MAQQVGGMYGLANPRFQTLQCPHCKRCLAVEIPPGYRTANRTAEAHYRAHLLKYHYDDLRHFRKKQQYAMRADGSGRT